MTSPRAPLRVIELVAENVKKLRAVEIRPSGDVVTIGIVIEDGLVIAVDGVAVESTP
jgi:hypothetical protein